MDDLVRIPKISAGERNQSSKHGRPQRVDFALRCYGTVCLLAIPNALLQDGDSAEFFKSSTGFAVQLSPDGSRKITTKKNTPSFTATLPKEIRDRLGIYFNGSITVPYTVMPNSTYFFKFADIEAAARSK